MFAMPINATMAMSAMMTGVLFFTGPTSFTLRGNSSGRLLEIG